MIVPNSYDSKDNDVEVLPDFVHSTLFEVFISGGRSLRFHRNSFRSLPGLSFVRIEGTRSVLIDTKAFYNLTSSSLLVEIENCDDVTIKTGAFDDMKAFIDADIKRVKRVSLGKCAFSKLNTSKFKSIGKLELSESTFEFKNQGNIGRHGPVTSIQFENVIFPEIPTGAFFSSLALISINGCRISDIHEGAFRANQISDITFWNTTIDTIHNRALTDRTLVKKFTISKCNIAKIQSGAVLAAFFNFTVHYSIITDIEKDAVHSTAATVEIIGNEIANFKSEAFQFVSWNKIFVQDNIIKNLESNFIVAPPNNDIKMFSFKSNEVYNAAPNALYFLSELDKKCVYVDDNFFNESCGCAMEDWLKGITNGSDKVENLMETSFCKVNEYLSKCYTLPMGLLNMRNFTELSCTNKSIKCEPYNGEVRLVNNSSKIFLNENNNKQTWVIIILTIGGLLIVIAMISFIIMLIRGGRWLKRKGYFRNIHYNNNETSQDDENTMVTMDYNDPLDIPDELTLDFLQMLKVKLDDPTTHQQASEMIERLYEMFVVDDNYDNNARQEEAHLYEELGNMNMSQAPPPYQEKDEKPQNEARSILKLMEEKFNLPSDESLKPSIKSEYSEPSDAAVHLYSELKQNKQKSDGSLNTMGARPLPSKPEEFIDPVPSTSANV
ncbi:unnamed protein product [Brassicogethes aeneus]|uniref:Uncharacterized protein n=1 Tax=Brassicogethes aeneus TaxID=1431903 RepID=A0A9P0AR87_BRAAE|nr:unnamed protein product [Brassicogethes aeneus]